MLHQAGTGREAFPGVAGLFVIGAIAADRISRRVSRVAEEYADEQQKRERLRRYFSPEVAESILQGTPGEKPERRQVTVLFADIRGFTALSEALPPEAVVSLLDEYFAAMTAVIFRNGGTLDKFIGDGLMAVFGAPKAVANHAGLAVCCALEMVEALTAVNQARRARGEAEVKIGIGLHSGSALVGTIGPELRREYTAIGDTVNTASRVEGLTRELGAVILATEATREAAGDGFAWSEAGKVTLRGKTGPVTLFVPGGGMLALTAAER